MIKTLEAKKIKKIPIGVVKEFAFPVCAASLFVLLIFRSSDVVNEAKSMLALCFTSVVPSLFPFFVASSLIVSSGAADVIGKATGRIVSVLFGINGNTAVAVFTGMMSGAPTGAKMCAELYNGKLCSKIDAEKAMRICNGVSPAFCVAFVGRGIYHNPLIGWFFWLIHITASIIAGVVLLRKKTTTLPFFEKQHTKPERLKFSAQIVAAVRSGVMSSIYVTGFITIFAVCNALLRSYGVMRFVASGLCAIFPKLSHDGICGVLSGIIEFTTGVGQLGKSAFCNGKADTFIASMISFVLGFGGVSVYCQTSAFANDAGLETKGFIGFKLFVAALSAAMSIVIFSVLNNMFFS